MISFHLKYAINTEIYGERGLLLDLISEYQTYVGVKLDLPCCVGVCTLEGG